MGNRLIQFLKNKFKNQSNMFKLCHSENSLKRPSFEVIFTIKFDHKLGGLPEQVPLWAVSRYWRDRGTAGLSVYLPFSDKRDKTITIEFLNVSVWKILLFN